MGNRQKIPAEEQSGPGREFKRPSLIVVEVWLPTKLNPFRLRKPPKLRALIPYPFERLNLWIMISRFTYFLAEEEDSQ